MWHKEKNRNPIVRLALLLALASTPMMTSLFKSDYVLAQTPSETPSFPLPTAVPNGTKIRIDGSSSMTRANEALKQRFEKEYSGTNVELATNGTDDALKALQEGKIDIAAIGRGLTPEELEKLGLEQQRLRREKIAIIVGKENPFDKDLSNQLFTKIYTGEVTDWSEVGGAPGKIRVIDRPDFSDTREAFSDYPLFRGRFKTGSTATQLDSDDPAEVVKQLGKDGIGFVLANQVEKLDNVRILSMHKTLPDDPRYPYSQPLVYVFQKNPPEAVKNFVGFATAQPGQEALKVAREEESAAVAAAVARAVSGETDNDTATPGATPGSNSANADGKAAETKNETANSESAGKATNTSASDEGNTGKTETAFLPGENAGASAEAGEGTIPWWWILLPVAVIGALAFWWLLGRRKSQEDDTVARGVLPKDAPPPFTPTSTTTSGAVKEPEPVANAPVESNAGINAAGIAAGAATVAGLGAALSSRDEDNDREAPEIRDEFIAETSSELRLDNPDLQDVSGTGLDIESPDLPEPDIPDTSLDLEAPAAVVNSSYPSLPRINVPIDEEVPSTTEPVVSDTPLEENLDNNPSPQEELPSASTTNFLGNFALGTGVAGAAAAAGAGAQKIKSRLAGKDKDESVENESSEINGTVAYPELPDVWDGEPAEQPTTEEVNNDAPSSLWGTPQTQESSIESISATPSDSSLLNRDREDTPQEVNQENNDVISPSSLWENPQAQESNIESISATPSDSSLFNRDDENTPQEVDNQEVDNVEVEENQDLTLPSPSSLWETPQTQESNTEETEEKEESSFPLGGTAVGAGLAAGAAAIGSRLFNRDNSNTDEDSNKTEENHPVEEQEDVSANSGLGSGWFLNRFRKNPTAEQSQTTENPGLPEVRITNSNEQLADVETTPQEQPETGSLPNVRITQSNQTNIPEETVSEEQIAQFGMSSTSEDNSAVLAGAAGVGAFALGSQIKSNDEESHELDSESENVVLDQVADQAEINTQIPTSQEDSVTTDTNSDKIHGLQNNGATVPAQSSILLTNRTPKWAYASWNISATDREAMRNRGANQLVLRLYDTTDVDLSYQNGKLVQQYECEETVNHRYVAIPNTERDYVTEIGYLTANKEWLLVSRSPIVRVFSRPHTDFWFEADAELIIHGATEPGSKVTIDGQNIKVKQDGTFHLRVPFTESLINYLITAVAPDSEQAKTIHMQFTQKERDNS